MTTKMSGQSCERHNRNNLSTLVATIYFDFKEIPSTWLLFGITLLTLVQSCPTQPFHTFYEGDVNCLLQHQVVRIPLDAIRIHHRAVDGIHAGIDRTCWDCMLEPVQYHVSDLDWNTGTRRQRHVALWSIRLGHSSVDMHGVFPALKERDNDIGQLPCSHVAIVFTSHVPDVKIQFRQVESWVEEKVSLTPPLEKISFGNNILGNNFKMQVRFPMLLVSNRLPELLQLASKLRSSLHLHHHLALTSALSARCLG